MGEVAGIEMLSLLLMFVYLILEIQQLNWLLAKAMKIAINDCV